MILYKYSLKKRKKAHKGTQNLRVLQTFARKYVVKHNKGGMSFQHAPSPCIFKHYR